MSRLIILIVFLFNTSVLSASTVQDYAAQRKQILESAPEERREIIKQHNFDTNTVLGKYFYLSTFLYLENDPTFYALSDEELDTLRRDYPEYYYEREVLMAWLSDEPPQKKFKRFRAVQDVAREKSWPRIEGWATSLLVLSLQASELHFNAILEMNNYTPRAAHVETIGMTYSYSLMAIFYQMYVSLFSLNDYEGALKFCLKYKNYLPNDISVQIDGLSCEVAVLIKLERLDEAFVRLKEMSPLVEQTGLVESRIWLLRDSAIYYRAKGRPDLTFMYAKDALDLYHQTGKSLDPTIYGLYSLLTLSQIELKNVELAEFYLNKMLQAPTTTLTSGPLIDADIFIASARISELKGEQKKAMDQYEKAIKALSPQPGSSFSFRELKEVNDSINARELEIVEKKLALQSQQAERITLLAIFSTFCALIAGLFLWRLIRHKRELESFSRLDNLTRVYNRWYAIDLLKKRLNAIKRQDDRVCVALIDIDHFKRFNDTFGHQTGDAILTHFARLCKYQFRDNDIFGRYGGEEFILMLDKISLENAKTKLHALKQLLERQALSEFGADGTLQFSAGVIEVNNKTDVVQVLSACDKLLYSAKHNGRNQSIGAVFNPQSDSQPV
ncbi:GGDEF domain-containing protein [Salinimonas chungwhensis]|uniref:GGDEF domain-containing protein n=1 Tax=Salinimonas chungwhensis TaxID=265425 RepID=UPI00037218BA|nr:GGDEF domain-containing protein [Salinimonas chungwhensis]